MDLDKWWKQLFLNTLLENIKNSSNKLFSLRLTSPASKREELCMQNQAGFDHCWQHRAMQPSSATLVSILTGSVQGWAGLGGAAGWKAGLQEMDFSALANPLSRSQLSNNSQTDLAVSSFMNVFLCVLGKSLWPTAVWAWAGRCSDPSYRWTLGCAVKWRSGRSCH